MTAEEIRAYDGDGYNADEAMFCMLREIAAQLAELNAKLANIPIGLTLLAHPSEETNDNEQQD